MSDELKPCPFCGGDSELDTFRYFIDIYTGRPDDGVAIHCIGECHAEMTLCRADVPDLSIEEIASVLTEHWNRRTSKPAVPVANLSKLAKRFESVYENTPDDAKFARGYVAGKNELAKEFIGELRKLMEERAHD